MALEYTYGGMMWVVSYLYNGPQSIQPVTLSFDTLSDALRHTNDIGWAVRDGSILDLQLRES